MKKPEYRLLPKAEEDAIEITTYITGDNPHAADGFLEALQSACERLAGAPGIGRVREFTNPALRGTRSWPIKGFEKYLIFYRSTLEGIEVVRVVHGARDLPTLFGEGE